MAYSIANPPACISTRVGANGGAIWWYNSTDAATVVRVDTYISNGVDLGMKIGDLVIQTDLIGATVAHQYIVITLNADGSVDLTDGSAIVVTNSD